MLAYCPDCSQPQPRSQVLPRSEGAGRREPWEGGYTVLYFPLVWDRALFALRAAILGSQMFLV